MMAPLYAAQNSNIQYLARGASRPKDERVIPDRGIRIESPNCAILRLVQPRQQMLLVEGLLL